MPLTLILTIFFLNSFLNVSDSFLIKILVHAKFSYNVVIDESFNVYFLILQTQLLFI